MYSEIPPAVYMPQAISLSLALAENSLAALTLSQGYDPGLYGLSWWLYWSYIASRLTWWLSMVAGFSTLASSWEQGRG